MGSCSSPVLFCAIDITFFWCIDIESPLAVKYYFNKLIVIHHFSPFVKPTNDIPIEFRSIRFSRGTSIQNYIMKSVILTVVNK